MNYREDDKYNSLSDEFFEEGYTNYIINNLASIPEEIFKKIEVKPTIIDEKFSIVTLNDENAINNFSYFQTEVETIAWPQLLSFFTLNATSPVQAANIPQFHTNKYLNLTGNGVIICFIDSGIDYLDEEFIYENNASKILEIWDQTIGKQSDNKDILFGTIYTRSQINGAIAQKDIGDPYLVVPSKDEIGHGTMVARYAAGRTIGAAPNSDIIMIKLKQTNLSTRELYGIHNVDIPVYDLVNNYLALRYVNSLIKKYNKPIVLCYGMGTNVSAHDGSCLIEKTIDILSENRGFVCVAGVGNQGISDTHFVDTLKDTGDTTAIQLNIAPDEKGLRLDIWCIKPDIVSVGIASPRGDRVEKIDARRGRVETINFVYEGTAVVVIYQIPEQNSGDMLVSLIFKNVAEGIWNITVYGDNIFNGRIDAWIYQGELLNAGTRILNSNSDTTLMSPSTSRMAITTSYYNQQTGNIDSKSGRGFARDGSIKPDISVGGYDNDTGVASSSVATAVIAGSAALILQWGIIDKKYPMMFASTVKSYMIQGTEKANYMVYPNEVNGYGRFFFDKMIEEVTSFPSGSRQNNNLNFDIKDSENMDKKCLENILNPNYTSCIVEYFDSLDNIKNRFPELCIFELSENYAIFIMPAEKSNEIYNRVRNEVIINKEIFFTLNANTPLDAAGVNNFHSNIGINLTGEGVIIGMADSGIDIFNEEFIDENGKSKILYAWDQTIDGKKSADGLSVLFGSLLTNEDINNEIKNKGLNENPPLAEGYAHGTKCALLIGGNKTGAAPKTKFIFVKLRPSNVLYNKMTFTEIKNFPLYLNTDIFLAINFLSSTSKAIKMPTVVHLALGSTIGGHDGGNLIERQIDSLSISNSIFFVTGTGNEGGYGGHAYINIEQGSQKSIEYNLGQNDNTIGLIFYCSGVDRVSIGMISPLGEVINKLPLITNVQVIRFSFDKSIAEVRYNFQERYTGSESILVKITNATHGVWTFNLFGESVVDKRVDIWIKDRVLRDQSTRLLNSSDDITLTIPGTARYISVCSYYNQITGGIIPESGRGFTRDNEIRPDVAVGGYDITTKTASSSIASSVYAGAIALIVQWGLVQKNDNLLNPRNIKNYILMGGIKAKGRVYPNRFWGYGYFNLNTLFNAIGQSTEFAFNSNIFIRKPTSYLI